jgi:hypothetical protein
MTDFKDKVILNQAKALEGMRQRLRSHGKNRQLQIDRMEEMIADRDKLIAELRAMLKRREMLDIVRRDIMVARCKEKQKILLNEIERLNADRPEGYDSELTRKCQELESAKQTIKDLREFIGIVGKNMMVHA